MKKITILFIFCVLLHNTYAQKKIIPATQSQLTGISLPEGSKQDSRLLVTIAAKTLLADEAIKMNSSVTKIEVLYLPPASNTTWETIQAQLQQSGFKISPSTDKKIYWLQKVNQNMAVYFSVTESEINLYVGELNTAPAAKINNSVNNNNTKPPANNTTKPPSEQGNNTSQQQVNSSAFTYTSTTFNDGWTSVIKNDWVEVTKGDIQVYIWYALPYNASDFSGTGLIDRDYYWDNYVSKYFNIQTKQYKDNGEVLTSQKPSYVEGWATFKQTGERRFIGMRLDISPNAAYITIASAKDEAALWAQFPKANGGAWSPSDISAMGGYNKFAIAPNDLIGTWQNGNTSTMQWYYVTPGGYEGYAGMTVAATSATFNFSDGGNYTSIHNGATGSVSNMNTFQQNYKGKYTITNWTVTATNRWEGKPEAFDAWFMAIRGGRI